MSKKRIQLKLENSEKIITVAWYIGTPQPNIIELIKQAFGLGSLENQQHQDIRMIGLYDSDGDLVVLSDSIPNDQIFTVKFLISESVESLRINQGPIKTELNRTDNRGRMMQQQPDMQPQYIPQQPSNFSSVHTRRNSLKGNQFESQNVMPGDNDEYFSLQTSPSYLLKGHQPSFPMQQYTYGQSIQPVDASQYQQQFYEQPEYQGEQMPPQYYGYQQNQIPPQNQRISQQEYWQNQQMNQPQGYYPNEGYYPRQQNFSPRQSPNRFINQQQAINQPQSVRMLPTARFSPNNQGMNQDQYNNLQAMGMGLRGGRKMSPNGSIQQVNVQKQNQKVENKRNNLKIITQGDLGIPKGMTGTQSQTSSQESADQVMSLKMSDNRNEQLNQAAQNILNTPLANTMKKVGMTPNLNNKLSDFVVKKTVNGASTIGSPLITMSRDGTGGPQGTINYQYQNQMANPQTAQIPQRFFNQASSSGGFSNNQEYLGSQIGDPDDLMMFNDNIGSPRSMFYMNQNNLANNMNYPYSNMNPDDTYSVQGDYVDMQGDQRQYRQKQPMFRTIRPSDKNHKQPQNQEINYNQNFNN